MVHNSRGRIYSQLPRDPRRGVPFPNHIDLDPFLGEARDLNFLAAAKAQTCCRIAHACQAIYRCRVHGRSEHLRRAR
jgi:hypothetical protein